MALITYLLPTILIALSSASNTRPRPLAWSSRTYGPDGPWQAIEVQVGTPGQPIDLYPGGAWSSLIFATAVCDDSNNTSPTCLAKTAGVYEPLNSTTSFSVPSAGGFQNSSGLAISGYQNLVGSGTQILDQLTVIPGPGFTPAFVPSLSMMVLTQAYSTLADGTKYPALVGNLALGAEVPNQTWTQDGQQINGTLITNFLYDEGQVSSASYGLHIGSVQHGIPGSLYLGGYDQLRILGSVSVQGYASSALPIDLLDIGIGVAEGGSPFPYSFKSGLLAQGNDSIPGFIHVEVDPKEPYLYLPTSTCAAIAQELPVTFQPKYGLYFWNTADPRYQQIVTSPSFLAFTFRFNNSISQNFTIKVPFALLNLTLTAPMVSVPTPYFPCSLPRLPEYRLGRSFLQAAFIGLNWETDYIGVWYLAQAPGPNIGIAPTVMAIGPTDQYVIASENDWAESWSKTWVPLPMNSSTPAINSDPAVTSTSNNSNPAATSTSSPSLTTGEIVAISISGFALCAFLIVGSCLLRRRRRRRRRRMEELQQALVDNSLRIGPYEVSEDDMKRPPGEMHSEPPKCELSNGEPTYEVAELPTHTR